MTMNSPTSSSSPLLPIEDLPRWFKQLKGPRRYAGLPALGRFKIILIAGLCMLLGYMLTSGLSTSSYEDYDSSSTSTDYTTKRAAHHAASPHLAGSGTSYSPLDADGVLDTTTPNAMDEELDLASHHPAGQHGTARHRHTRPSIGHALSDLHHAVSDRLSSLRPGKSSSSDANGTGPGVFTAQSAHNLTSLSVSDTLIPPGRDLLGERSRVGKVTIIFGHSPTYERALRTHEAHDRMHGYPLHVLRHGIMDDVWSKPAYILSILLRELARPEDERLQWLLWVDADTVLLNPYVPIETFLPPSPEFDDVNLLVTNDWNGLNNGVFPVRVCQWSADLFAAIVSFRFYRPDVPLVFRDQTAMDVLIKDKRFRASIVEAPQRWFNAYQGEHNETLAPYQVRRGDFLVHFAGVGDRDARMGYWLERTEQHLPDWEMQVQHTSYPGEAREFWGGVRERRLEAKKRLNQAKEQAREAVVKTETLVGEYRDRIPEGDLKVVTDRVKRVQDVLGKTESDVEALVEVTQQLVEARRPLEAASTDASKSLTKQAHEAIFAAEKAMMGAPDKSAGEYTRMEERLSRLKEVVIQTGWSRADMVRLIDEAGEARTALELKTPAPVVATSVAGSLDAPDSRALAEAEKSRLEAEAAKADILGLAPTKVSDAPLAILTYTGTIIEQQTHVVVAQETVTVGGGGGGPVVNSRRRRGRAI